MLEEGCASCKVLAEAVLPVLPARLAETILLQLEMSSEEHAASTHVLRGRWQKVLD